MRRFASQFSIVALVLAGLLVVGGQPAVIAQEATPASEEGMEGLTYEAVTAAFGADLTSPSDIFVARIGFEPGSGFPITADDPTVGLLIVESGTVTVQVDGDVSVTRGATFAEGATAAEESGDFASVMEAITPGEAVTLEAGDAAYIPGNVDGEIRNDGDEPAVALTFVIIPPGGMMEEATPEA
jgi:quercetin dioxygenase-like cupin family protein